MKKAAKKQQLIGDKKTSRGLYCPSAINLENKTSSQVLKNTTTNTPRHQRSSVGGSPSAGGKQSHPQITNLTFRMPSQQDSQKEAVVQEQDLSMMDDKFLEIN